MPIIMISGHGSLELAVRAIQKGAYDFIEKPIEIEKLLLSINRALEVSALKIQVPSFHMEKRKKWPIPLNALLQKACRMETPLLLKGERGMPLERLAHDLHEGQKQGPFLAYGASQLNALEDHILWGQEDDAGIQEIGWIEKLKQGTFAILNIQHLSMPLQITLAKIFESHTFLRKGGRTPVPCCVRFIGTLTGETKTPFYPPFLQRFSGITHEVDALNSKRKHIPLWCDLLLQEHAKAHGLPLCSIDAQALASLEKVNWTNSVDQLKNVLDAALMSKQNGEPIVLEDFALSRSPTKDNYLEGSFYEARERFELAYIRYQLAACDGSISRAAQFMGIERSTLHRKIKNNRFSPNVCG